MNRNDTLKLTKKDKAAAKAAPLDALTGIVKPSGRL